MKIQRFIFSFGLPFLLLQGTIGCGLFPSEIPTITTAITPTHPPVPSATATKLSMPFTIQPISAGSSHTCVLTIHGGVKCWGDNRWGQLGNGAAAYWGQWGKGAAAKQWDPVDVRGLSGGVISLSAGMSHTCALTAAGGVKCWGSNVSGQLGDGTNENCWTPVDVKGLDSGIVAIDAGGEHTCALTSTGGVKCWGFALEGELGDDTYRGAWSAVPLDVKGLDSGVVAITAGFEHTCAVTSEGGVKCWGSNLFGQLGDETTPSSDVPVDIKGLGSGIVAISAGFDYTCALTYAGGVTCWGSIHGQDVCGSSSGIRAISAGSSHVCALTTGGGVKCWGSNEFGQLGDGTTEDHWMPVDVIGLTSGVRAIAAGGVHTCALTTAGEVKCWGDNTYHELGDTDLPDSTTPIDVIGLTSQ